ncbi:MAG: DUF2851 family protein [Bacteroidota bacterium]
MFSFKEDFLQFLWHHKLFLPLPFITVSGKEIRILKQGELNHNAGPDFFNAQIKIQDLLLVGNVEIHIKTSDWLKHGHLTDVNYNNLILHAVYEHDMDLEQNVRHRVEVLELKKLIDPQSLNLYMQVFQTKQKLVCANQLKHCKDIVMIAWLERMSIKRLEEKFNRLHHWFEYYQLDYTQTFYISLLRNFGFNVNGEAFELLAKQLPLIILLKHSKNLIQLESLLLGTAGLLDQQYKNDYLHLLQNEFEFLRNKYSIIPLNKALFKFSRLRPANFPDLRLAQFAALLHHAPEIFMAPQLQIDYAAISKKFAFSPDGYWQNHYSLDGESQLRPIKLGKQATENTIINSFAPFLFFYARKTGHSELEQKALALWQACQFEVNSISKLFSAKKTVLKTAADSQALIQLFHSYCKNKRCLTCGIGSGILKPPSIS